MKQSDIEDLKHTVDMAHQCLQVLIESSFTELNKIAVFEELPKSSALPESDRVRWVKASEVLCRTMSHLATADAMADDLLKEIHPEVGS